jgi:hypothetical protein
MNKIKRKRYRRRNKSRKHGTGNLRSVGGTWNIK